MNEPSKVLEMLKEQLIPAAPEFYYDIYRKEYLIKQTLGTNEREWIPQNERQIRMALVVAGIRGTKAKNENLSPVDLLMHNATQNSNSSVHYSGALAGYSEGIIQQGGVRCLITSSPRIIKPAEGDWSTIRKIMEGLFGDPAGIQLPFIHAHNKLSYIALRQGITRGMPAQVFCGPADCGKSLYQSLILTSLYGGRSQNPYTYMTDKTQHNGELFTAEHMMMSDEVTIDTTLAARRAFGARIKQMVANEDQRMRGMYADARNLRPFWRLTLALNNELENILALPPLDASLKDKLSLFKAHSFEFPMPMLTQDDKVAAAKKILSEMPAYIHWLENYEIPAEILSRRWTVGTYQHPEILACLNAVSPEYRLAELISKCYLEAPVGSFDKLAKKGHRVEGLSRATSVSMTASELESGLTSTDSPVCYEARKLLSGGRQINTYLSRLSSRYPDNVFKDRGTRGERLWTITGISDILNSHELTGSADE